MTRAEEIRANLARVVARVRGAEEAAGRPPGSARVVAVSKRMPADDVRAAFDAGQRDFGESYAQEMAAKMEALDADGAPGGGGAGAIRWHFVGPLQTNKVKLVAGRVALVHSVDSRALLAEIDRRLAGAPSGTARPARQACLVQVNVAGEPRKRGVAPDALGDLLDAFGALARVECAGLMLIPPLSDDTGATRAHFAALARLREQHAGTARPGVDLRELSMGMTGDLEVAVAAGATLVRVGTAIFGVRPR